MVTVQMVTVQMVTVQMVTVQMVTVQMVTPATATLRTVMPSQRQRLVRQQCLQPQPTTVWRRNWKRS